MHSYKALQGSFLSHNYACQNYKKSVAFVIFFALYDTTLDSVGSAHNFKRFLRRLHPIYYDRKGYFNINKPYILYLHHWE